MHPLDEAIDLQPGAPNEWTGATHPAYADMVAPSLAALCDSFFPRIYVRRRRRVLIGTVSLTTFFHADNPLLAQVGTRHVLGVAKVLNFRNGYFDQTGEIWSPEGQMLASTHQLVYFKD